MITLWGRNNSTNVKKVLWTLEELELPYDQILAGGKFGVNQDADYLAMNPNGLVPLLKDDETDLLLWESNAIVRYLAAQYGQNRLWVDNPARRAEGEKWMDWANQTLSPAHRVILMGLVRTPPEKRDQAAIEAGIEKCDGLFALLDDALAHQPWFSGDNFGTGDIAIAPFVYNLLNV
ncbi:glutathione S-transferase family protein, partial [Salmonella sp. 741265130_HBA]